ncbi:hypothetical protein DFH07DRAFT_941574 [Mycena maculata]|uniref:Uncharacterized protein n=1 Tax=Mycena maculata TaxID=230809 RepID=A0AAD7IYD8_9AGAR|nr:hypothetical protein DFH07DRAFT_941574 [Mycena maculata]
MWRRPKRLSFFLFVTLRYLTLLSNIGMLLLRFIDVPLQVRTVLWIVTVKSLEMSCLGFCKERLARPAEYISWLRARTEGLRHVQFQQDNSVVPLRACTLPQADWSNSGQAIGLSEEFEILRGADHGHQITFAGAINSQVSSTLLSLDIWRKLSTSNAVEQTGDESTRRGERTISSLSAPGVDSIGSGGRLHTTSASNPRVHMSLPVGKPVVARVIFQFLKTRTYGDGSESPAGALVVCLMTDVPAGCDYPVSKQGRPLIEFSAIRMAAAWESQYARTLPVIRVLDMSCLTDYYAMWLSLGSRACDPTGNPPKSRDTFSFTWHEMVGIHLVLCTSPLANLVNILIYYLGDVILQPFTACPFSDLINPIQPWISGTIMILRLMLNLHKVADIGILSDQTISTSLAHGLLNNDEEADGEDIQSCAV